MMKAAVVLCLLATAAFAAPGHVKLDPSASEHARLAEEAWAAASAESDPSQRGARWEAAANAFALVDGDALGPAYKQTAAASAAIAWRNALDAYDTAGQYDRLVALADALAAKPAVFRNHDDLAAVVANIQRARHRMHAAQLEREAKESRELSHYVACGDAYLAMYNAAPDAVYGDEVLYNAAVCYRDGGAIRASIDAFTHLRKAYPNGRLAMNALAWIGKTYADIAMYDRAADALEQYAAKYAGERDAYDAMNAAVFYRRAIGDRAKWLEDTQYFIKTFGAKKPGEAADAMFSLTAYYESTPDKLIKHLREYIARFGAKGGREHLVVAHAKLGLALFEQSCRVGGVDGLCVRSVQAPRTCSKEATRTLVVVERDMKTLKSALEAFHAAAADDDTRYWAARARLAEADIAFEKFLAVSSPTNLDFTPARRMNSLGRLSSWIGDKQTAASLATRTYDAVLAMKDPATSILAAERIASINLAFATALETAKRPRGDLDSFCDAVTSTADPLRASAIEAYSVCLMKSTELGWWSDASARCERELVRSEPDAFPALRELRSGATNMAPVIAAEPPTR